MTVQDLAEKIQKVMDAIPRPVSVLPPSLLYCVAIKRSGMSLSKTFGKTISDMAAGGLNTKKNPDGTENCYNILTYCIEKNILETIKNDGVVQAAGLAGSVMFTGTGANAGGPVVVEGINSNNFNVMGGMM